MKILLCSDIHGKVKWIPAIADEIQSADFVIAAGDITNFGGAEKAKEIVESFIQFNRSFFAVPGNCDLDDVDQYLESKNMSLHGKLTELDEIYLVGVGGSLPCPGYTPNEEGEGFFRDILEESYKSYKNDKPLILVTHQPAYGIKLDRLTSGGYCGSKEIRAFIERYQPFIAVSGHIHEAVGIDNLGNTLLINPGALKERHYAVLEIRHGEATVELREFRK